MAVSRSPSFPPSGSPSYSPDNLPVYRGGSAGSAPGPVTLLYDSFTEATATAIADHTPDTIVSPAATPWAENGEFYRVDGSGVLELRFLASANRQCWIQAGIADGIFSLGSIVNGAALMFRRVDATNYWFVYNITGVVQLWEINSTSGNVNRGGYDTGATGPKKVQVIADGDSIDVYVDGTLRISHTSSVHATATVVGVRAESGAGGIGAAVADDLYVINSTDPADLP